MAKLIRNGKTIAGTPTKVDTAKSYTTFDSKDVESPTEWSDVELLQSGEEQNNLFSKISSMFKNIRFLNNKVSNVDTQLANTVLPKHTESYYFKTAGWYRVAKLTATNLGTAKGSSQSGLDVQILKNYNGSQPEMHRITIVTSYQKGTVKFVNEISHAEILDFTKIRYTADEATNTGYIELYYNTDVDNVAQVILSNTITGSYLANWNIMDVTPTEETLEGVTVMGEHEFSANKSYESEIAAVNEKLDIETLVQNVSALSIDKSGKYYIFAGTDLPTGFSAGHLDVSVYSDTNFRTLKFTPHSNANIYVNTLTNGTWTGWVEKANTKNISYTDSSYSGNFPKAIQQAVADGVLTTGTWSGQVVAGGSIGYYSGVVSGDYASFNVHSYGSQFNYHLMKGVSGWTTDQIARTSQIETLNTSVSKLKYEWTANIKCATWSRLCYVTYKKGYRNSFILYVGIYRDNVVYTDTFIVTCIGSSNGTIVKIGGNYTNPNPNYSVRLVTNINGNSFFEIYDETNGVTAETTQLVDCTLIPIYTGTVDCITEFSDGTTHPEGHAVAKTMTVTKTDFQSDVTDSINSRLAYKDISSSIDVGETGCTATGYVENGNVQLQIIIPAATVSGEKKLYIDTQYAPRLIAGGQIIPITTDYGKIHTCYVSTNGEIYIYTNATLTGEAKVTFTYPLRTS